jgi:hypothetical protein
MMKTTSSKQSKAPVKRRGVQPDSDQMNQATGKDFEREGMGIAPKE